MLRNRIILLILWIVSLVGISFYGGPLAYGFFTVITLIPVFSLLYIFLVLICFKMYQSYTGPNIVCNHVVPFYFTLQNEDLFTFSGIRVTFYSDFSMIDGVSDRIEYELLPHTKIKRNTTLICRYRGEYNVGIRSVILTDYFRLFKITYKNREPLKVNVLPDIIELDRLQSIDTDSVSDRFSAANPSIPDITVRDYFPGDDIRHLNWKQTAKLGKPMIRNHIGEEKEGICLIIECFRKSDIPSVYLPVENRILETAIAICNHLKDKRIPVSVIFRQGGLTEMKIDSPDSFRVFYEKMSDLSFEKDNDTTSFYEEITYNKTAASTRLTLIITDELNDALISFTDRFYGSENDIMIYLISDDKDTPVQAVGPHTRICTVPTDGDLKEII